MYNVNDIAYSNNLDELNKKITEVRYDAEYLNLGNLKKEIEEKEKEIEKLKAEITEREENKVD